MSGMNELNEGAKLFKEKKEECLKFLEKAVNLTREYDAAFPPGPEPDGGVGKPRSEKFENIEKKIGGDKLKILVAGQFKQGKSTLINALLGEEVLPAYSTPCTAVITEIAYDDNKRAIISFKKKIGSMPNGLSKRTLRHIGEKRENIPDLVVESDNLGEELEEYLVIPEEEDKEQREAVAESPYLCCKLKWPLELCRNEVEIIDSPGLNEATARDNTTYTYVPQADMILHVLNANQLFGKPDKEFVDKAMAFGCGSILFLVNRFDQLNTERDRERVRNRALKELCDYTEYGVNGIFFISSYKALNGRMENNEKLYSESGFSQFEGKMANIIARDRVRIKLGDGIDAANSELGSIAHKYLPVVREKINQNVEELEKNFASNQENFKKLDVIKKRIEQIIERTLDSVQKMLKSDLRIFFNDFANDSITSYTDDCSINIGLFNKKSSTEAAIKKLSSAMLEGMKSDLEKFTANKQGEIKTILDDMEERIAEQLKDFNEILKSIRSDLNMVNKSDMNLGNKSPDVNDISVTEPGMADIMGEAVGGALVGGVAGAGAIWAAGQFFSVMAGPVGWGLAIAATLTSAVITLITSTSAEDKVKSEFVKKAAEKIHHESDAWATKLSNQMSEGLNQTRINMIERLNHKIAETKNPIIEAIDLLKKNQGTLELKKKELDDFQQKYKALYEAGKELRNKL